MQDISAAVMFVSTHACLILPVTVFELWGNRSLPPIRIVLYVVTASIEFVAILFLGKESFIVWSWNWEKKVFSCSWLVLQWPVLTQACPTSRSYRISTSSELSILSQKTKLKGKTVINNTCSPHWCMAKTYEEGISQIKQLLNWTYSWTIRQLVRIYSQKSIWSHLHCTFSVSDVSFESV